MSCTLNDQLAVADLPRPRDGRRPSIAFAVVVALAVAGLLALGWVR